MKHLLTICFVLAFAVLPAVAGLEMVVTGGYQQPGAPNLVGVVFNEIVFIDIYSDTEIGYEAILSKDYGLGHIYPQGTAIGPCVIDPIEYGYSYLLTAGGPLVPVTPGEHFAFTFEYDDLGYTLLPFSVVNLTDINGIVLDSYTFYDVPEPATIGLFALGVMFLRKRAASNR